MDALTREQIEDLGLTPGDTWYALLVVAGIRPSAWLHVESNIWREGDMPHAIANEQLERIRQVFHDANVSVVILRRVTDAGLFQPDESKGRRRLTELADILIAASDDVLSDLQTGVEQMDHHKIGIALGYPATAVAVFDKPEDKVLIDDLPPEIAYSEIGQFTNFALSKEHWKEELKTVRHWVDALKELSPLCYAQCRNDMLLPEEITDMLIKNSYSR